MNKLYVVACYQHYLLPPYFRATSCEDTTYTSPGTETAVTEGADGVYSYAATTTVVGAKMESKQKAGKKPSDETKDAQPDTAETTPPADVQHKQGPTGELCAIPEMKPLTVVHVQGPQGVMYAVSAKPSKVSESVLCVSLVVDSCMVNSIHSSITVK